MQKQLIENVDSQHVHIPRSNFIQNLILIDFPGLMLKFTGVYCFLHSVYWKHISMLCSHHKLLLAAGSPEEKLRHSKSDWTNDQSVDGSCRRVGAGGRRLNSQELPVGWNQKPRTSRHLLRNFFANWKPWPIYRFLSELEGPLIDLPIYRWFLYMIYLWKMVHNYLYYRWFTCL